MADIACDVAIVGGGPGGSTVASLLRKFNPSLKVVVVEKEEFPRDHIGESQLPPISRVLDEMGAWDKIEAAGFPVKLGATYTWGKTTEPWVFGFIPIAEVKEEPRPGKYEGWRRRVAFQVDRAKYDKILLDHAASLGVDVLQPMKVSKVESVGEGRNKKVTALRLEDGRAITARYYIDASGNAALLRRQLGIAVDAPTLLRNVAFWDYWDRPGLNAPLIEKGAIRVQIRSVPFGWIWFIALSQDRTSVGLVCNAEYYKQSGKRPEELYREAIAAEKQVSGWLKDASSRGTVETTTDWSYVADQACGENWFLVGECLGFADPILAAGLTLTHTCAQHAACTILELERGSHDRAWLMKQYEETQTRRVRQHIKFAEYWYSANGLFSAVLENSSKIAAETGLSLSPQEAFRWLSNGGIDDVPGQFVLGGLGLSGIKSVQQRFSHEGTEAVRYLIDGMNTFTLDTTGASQGSMAIASGGAITRVPVLERGSARLPLTGIYGVLHDALKKTSRVDHLVAELKERITRVVANPGERGPAFAQAMQSLEGMAAMGWVRCSKVPGLATLTISTPEEGDIVYTEKLGPRSK